MSLPLLSSERKKSLLSLIDDDNQIVRNGILSEIRHYDKEGIEFLLDSKVEFPHLANSIADVLKALDYTDTEKDFKDFIHSLNYELETGFLMLDRIENPTLDIRTFQKELDRIANRVSELVTPPMSAFAHCKIINRILFHEFGFRGDREDYYNPDNASLTKALERKKGLPIILSIIYILVADRCGLQLEPIAFPGHFMVGCFRDEQAFFIDTYESGAFKNFDDLALELDTAVDENFIFQLAPAPVGEVLCRNCRNLANSFQKMADEKKSSIYQRLIREFEIAYKKNA